MTNLKDMSEVELKSLMFDISESIQKLQNDAFQIRQFIIKKQQESSIKTPEKPKK